MITLSEIPSFLLAKDLIQERSIVEGDLSISEASRRNHNIVVVREHGASYFLKEGVDQERSATLINEGKFYEFLQSIPNLQNKGYDRYLPKFYGYDTYHRILILEYLPGGQNLREYQLQHRYLPLYLARVLGDALGVIHSVTNVVQFQGNFWENSLVGPPWILRSMYNPSVEIYQTMSSGNIHLIKILQQFPTLHLALDILRDEWKNIALIHGDVKLDNCIVYSPSISGRKTRIKLVDWELSQIGDPWYVTVHSSGARPGLPCRNVWVITTIPFAGGRYG